MSETRTQPTSGVYHAPLIGAASLDPSVEKIEQRQFPRGLQRNEIVEACNTQLGTTAIESYFFQPSCHINLGSFGLLTGLFYATIFEGRPPIVAPSDHTTTARAKIGRFTDKAMAAQAIKILDEVERVLSDTVIKQFPPIYSFENDDNSLLIEWMSAHWRIGFSIERDHKESGWYLVSDEYYGNVRAYGNFESVDVKWLVAWALARLK